MAQSTCTRCGATFDAVNYRHKTCPDCARARERVTTRTRECVTCAKVFTYQVARGADRLHCSTACQQQKAAATARGIAKSFGPCAVDGCTVRKRSRYAEYCEMHYGRVRRNGDPHSALVRRPTGQCVVCSTPVKGRLYCSPLCATRERAGRHDLTERPCLVCAQPIALTDRHDRKYCSGDCKSLATRIRRYGLTIAEHDAIREKQGDGCAICGTSAERLVVDHDHDTGHVRGLLCGTCNAGLGMFKDSPDLMRAAIAYVRTVDREHPTQPATT